MLAGGDDGQEIAAERTVAVMVALVTGSAQSHQVDPHVQPAPAADPASEYVVRLDSARLAAPFTPQQAAEFVQDGFVDNSHESDPNSELPFTPNGILLM
jgi:hypothetical protein